MFQGTFHWGGWLIQVTPRQPLLHGPVQPSPPAFEVRTARKEITVRTLSIHT